MRGYDRIFTSKLCLLGPQAVGKTAVIRRYVNDQFSDRYVETIGTKVSGRVQVLYHDKQTCEMTNMIWDINGRMLTEGHREPLMDAHLQGSRGALVIYDSTNTATFNRIDRAIERFRRVNGPRPLVFMANKVDADANEEFVERLISKVASEWDSPYYFTSAKTGKNIEQAFHKLNKAILEQKVHA